LALVLLLLFAHLLRAYGQLESFLDPGEPLTRDTLGAVLLKTTWGRAWRMQVGAALLGLGMVLIGRGRQRDTAPVSWLGLAAFAVAATAPLTGHAREHPWGASLGIGLHTLHLLGGGTWLGTLAAALLTVVRHAADVDDHQAVARLIAAFSPVALLGAGTAVGAGLLLGYGYIGTSASLVGSLYGRTLLVKTALLVATMGFGAWNWRRLRPRLGTAAASRTLRRSMSLELLLGFLLLGVTAVLVALPAPRI
jgi:putative copper export protein